MRRKARPPCWTITMGSVQSEWRDMVKAQQVKRWSDPRGHCSCSCNILMMLNDADLWMLVMLIAVVMTLPAMIMITTLL